MLDIVVIPEYKRLKLENDYLWVYPVLGNVDDAYAAGNRDIAVGMLLVNRQVVVEKRLVGEVRVKLRAMGHDKVWK